MPSSREQRNARLFALARSTIKSNHEQQADRIDEWMTELERDANNVYPGWGDRLLAFLRGLWAAGLVDLAEIDLVEKELRK